MHRPVKGPDQRAALTAAWLPVMAAALDSPAPADELPLMVGDNRVLAAVQARLPEALRKARADILGLRHPDAGRILRQRPQLGGGQPELEPARPGRAGFPKKPPCLLVARLPLPVYAHMTIRRRKRSMRVVVSALASTCCRVSRGSSQ